MPLPLPPNIRFALYRGAAPPPADPVAADVPGYLEGAYDDGLEKAEQADAFRYTHMLLIDDSVDLHDDFAGFTAAGSRDLLYVPDAAGTSFEIVYVERPFGLSVKRAFLNRQPPPWPTNEL